LGRNGYREQKILMIAATLHERPIDSFSASATELLIIEGDRENPQSS
jgi:hypothetical protein